MADVEVTRSGGALWARLNRPEKLNAMLNSMKDDLLAALAEAESDPEVLAFVLTGTGRGFSAGADLGELASEAKARRTRLQYLERIERTHQFVDRLQGSRLVTIAAVNGVAAGGGVGLVLGCDVVFAATSAKLVFAFGARGLLPDTGLARTLEEAVGPRRARALSLLGEDVGAAEALRLGLFDRVVPDDQLDAEVRRAVEGLAVSDAEILALTKRLLSAPGRRDLAFEAVAQSDALARRERAQEAVSPDSPTPREEESDSEK